ncbi:MAG TPA: hypothetical protein VG145_10435, partial [Xanthobacteraceae bacterium]|nr:hypothetical protein [Xanthobacteraceae bacterium]
MKPRSVAAALIGLIFMVPLAQAQLPKAPAPPAAAPKAADSKVADSKPVDSKTQEFRVEDVAALASLPVGQLKPKAIAFADHPPENLVDPGTGFMRYEDWAKARPLEQQFLSLYPGYREPDADMVVDGVKKHVTLKLHMYVASGRFVLSRPPGSLDLARLVALPFVEQIDPAIKHTQIGVAEVTSTQEPKVVFNQNPDRRW